MGGSPRKLLAAVAANAGSVATLIGNPQNILIGQISKLAFVAFLGYCAAPALLALLTVFAVIAMQWRGRKTDSVSDGVDLAGIRLVREKT